MQALFVFTAIDWQDEISLCDCLFLVWFNETINNAKVTNNIYNNPALIYTKVSIYLKSTV